MTGDQVIDQGSTSGGDALTLAKLDEMLDAIQGSADVIFCNKTMRRKISTLARAANQATEPVNDAFGRQLQAYAGTPIAVIEEDKDGNLILPFDEDNPGGGTAASTSIYAVRMGLVEYVSGLQAGNMDVIDQGLQSTQYDDVTRRMDISVNRRTNLFRKDNPKPSISGRTWLLTQATIYCVRICGRCHM